MKFLSASLIASSIFSSALLIEAAKLRASLDGPVGPSKIFPLKKYEEYQISDGVAGKCKEHADAVFVDPFKKVNLQDITQTDLDNLHKMVLEPRRKEQLFIKAIAKAKGNASLTSQLIAGEVANKCLKITAEIQLIELQVKLNLHPQDADQRLNELKTKLTKNIDLDRQAAGQKMISYLSVDKEGSKSTEKKSGHNKNENTSKKEDEDDH